MPGRRNGVAGLEWVAALLPPVLAAGVWARWALGLVDKHEQSIATTAAGSSTFAAYIQLIWGHAHGLGWSQTVRVGGKAWWWDDHWGPAFLPIAWLASFSDSAWALQRVQVLMIASGCIAAWGLGLAEAALPGAVVALVMYATSAPTAIVALAEYQHITASVAMIPLAVWAVRHGGWLVATLALIVLGSLREELWLLLPVVGLMGGVRRALIGLAVAMGLVWTVSLAPGFHAEALPIMRLLRATAGFASARGNPVYGLNPGYYLPFCGGSLPWLALDPLAVAAVGGIASVQHVPAAGGVTAANWMTPHHLSPLIGVSLAGGIVGCGRWMRALPRLAWPTVVVAVAISCASARNWRTELLVHGVRAAPPHPAWELSSLIPPDAGLLVPDVISPAFARRRLLALPGSLGRTFPASSVKYYIDRDGILAEHTPPELVAHLDGTAVKCVSRWCLFELTTPLPDLPRAAGAQHR